VVSINTKGEKIFLFFNYIIIALLAGISLFPIVNILAVSFSSASAATAGEVKLWPVGFTLSAYKFVASNKIFFGTFLVSIERVLLAVPLSVFIIIMAAYPLSLTTSKFKMRSIYAWFFLFSIIFSGGLIPYLLTIQLVGIINTIWALVLPMSAPVFYIIIMMNFFKAIPSELGEAAAVDGASHMRILWQIFVPISKPAIATIVLLCFILQWNSWFDGLLLINNPRDYPLQSYLQTIVVNTMDINAMARNPEQWKLIQLVAERTVKSAQIFIAIIPVMIIYPFMQKSFTKGLIMGAVKG
jgi:putative aldouronate transport system permease protein